MLYTSGMTNRTVWPYHLIIYTSYIIILMYVHILFRSKSPVYSEHKYFLNLHVWSIWDNTFDQNSSKRNPIIFWNSNISNNYAGASRDWKDLSYTWCVKRKQFLNVSFIELGKNLNPIRNVFTCVSGNQLNEEPLVLFLTKIFSHLVLLFYCKRIWPLEQSTSR